MALRFMKLFQNSPWCLLSPVENYPYFLHMMEWWSFNSINFNMESIQILKSYTMTKTLNSHIFSILKNILKANGSSKSMKMQIKSFPVSIKNVLWNLKDKKITLTPKKLLFKLKEWWKNQRSILMNQRSHDKIKLCNLKRKSKNH